MIDLRLFDRNGTTLLGLLPQVISYSVGFEFNEIGALQFEYPADGVNASQIAELREIAVVDKNGAEVKNGRFVVTGISRDRTKQNQVLQVTAKSILWRFDTALIYGDTGVGPTRTFTNAKAGAMVTTVFSAAQTRGALAGLSLGFTATTDSNGSAWTAQTTIEFPSRTSVLALMRSLSDLDMIEFETQARQLRAANSDGLGTDKTTGSAPVVLRYGLNLTEAPEQVSAEEIASVALVEGDKELILERVNSTTLSTYGRIETGFTASGVSDQTVVQSLADQYLSTLNGPDRQLTVGLTLQSDAPQPFANFNVGDYVYTATTAGLERVRVRQITVSMSNGEVSATATLGDRIYEADLRVARRIALITANNQSVTNNEPPEPPDPEIVPDTLAPGAPTALTGTSSTYLSGGQPAAYVNLTWDAPTVNSDGSLCDDVKSYEVFIRTGTADPWQFSSASGGLGATIGGLVPSTEYRFSVIAIDTSGNRSDYATEFVITTAASTETSSTASAPSLSTRLGNLVITWNGLNSSNQAMPINFSYAAIHVSTVNNFTPSSSNLRGRFTGSGQFVVTDLAYNTLYYVKLVSYSTSGVASTPSTQVSITLKPLVDTDMIGQIIANANIKNGTIVASDKIVANSITAAQIAALTITGGEIAANAISADKIAAGSISADKIVATGITADKINGGSITASNVNISNGAYQLTVGVNNQSFAYLNVQPGSSLGVALNAVGFVSTNTAGWISACYPYIDDNRNLGTSSYRWKAVYAVDGTINTSDERLKTDIEEASLGLDFIKALQPVSYKWIVGGKEYEQAENGGVQFDENGDPIVTQIAGARRHWGFVAQQVKEVLDAQNAPDFGGWVLDDLDDPNSTQSLRYHEFIAPLVKAVQELAARIEALEAN